MTRWKTYFTIAIFSAIAVGLGYYSYISPNITLEKIRKAAQEKDKDRLRELIDFDSVKAGLKEDVRAQMVTSAGETLKDNPFAAFGMALASMIVDPLVEAIVSPAGLTRLMDSGRIDSTKKSADNVPAEKSPKELNTKVEVNIERGYDEFSRYRVRVGRSGEKADQLLILTLKREGLFSWKLSGVSIPSNLLSNIATDQVSLGNQQRASLLAIESSDLQADGRRENVIVLNAILRNSARFAQAYPALELTLTDERDEAVARRVLRPAEYLGATGAQQLAQGIGPGADAPLRIYFDTSGTRPIGYRMYLFYPTQDPEPATRQIVPESIRMLSGPELAALSVASPKPGAGAVQRPMADAKPSAAPSVCIEWGGFAIAEATRAQQALAPLALGPRLTQRRSEETAGWWVFIPPLGNRAAVLKKTAELKALGIDEYSVLQDEGNMRWAVSLGVFSGEEAARNRLEALRAKGVNSAQIGERDTQVAKIWFQVPGADAAQQARLREIAQTFPGTEVRDCP